MVSASVGRPVRSGGVGHEPGAPAHDQIGPAYTLGHVGLSEDRGTRFDGQGGSDAPILRSVGTTVTAHEDRLVQDPGLVAGPGGVGEDVLGDLHHSSQARPRWSPVAVAAGDIPPWFLAKTCRKYVFAGVRSAKVAVVAARSSWDRSASPSVVRTARNPVAPVGAIQEAVIVWPAT